MTLSSLPQKKTIRLRLIGGPEHIEEGYLPRAEIYVYAGEILEKTDAEIEEEWAKS